jgi:hypothetical protein
LALFFRRTLDLRPETRKIGFVWHRVHMTRSGFAFRRSIINNQSSFINAEASSARIGFVWRDTGVGRASDAACSPARDRPAASWVSPLVGGLFSGFMPSSCQ